MSSDTPLSAVPGWGEAHIDSLSPYWITTAEQVVGLAATATGAKTLEKHLGVSAAELRKLIDSARAALRPEVVAELEYVDTSQYGLGAIIPPEEKK